MPVRNTTKWYDAPAYYHVYNHGVGDEAIFRDDHDRAKFLSLLARHLDPDDPSRTSDGRVYQVYDVDLVAYCLMGNHFHLQLFQADDNQAMTQLMRSVATAYTMYFNKKHGRRGHLFEGIFKAKYITDEGHLMHLSRYIHMNPNPRRYRDYKWSSIAYYLGVDPPAWLKPGQINDMSPQQYREFLRSYEGKKAEIDRLKDSLANQ